MEIRKYQKKDSEALHKICIETADQRFVKTDKQQEAICLLFLDYYLLNESENVLVLANEKDEACGYIVCSVNPDLFKVENKKYAKRIMKRSFFLGLFAYFQNKTAFKLNAKYNCGMHMNITKDYQGKRYGVLLIDKMYQNIVSLGYSRLHLVTKNKNTRGYGFYKKYGFTPVKKCSFGSILMVYNGK